MKDEKYLSIDRTFNLSDETVNEPTLLQLVFIHNDVAYRYGFTFKKDEIIAEWLYGIPKKTEVYYFRREGMNIKVNENHFREAQKFIGLTEKGDNEIFRVNSLFISAVSAMGVELAKDLVQAMTQHWLYLSFYDHQLYDYANIWIEETLQETLALLKAADTGIEGLRYEEDPSENAVSKITGKRKLIFYTSRNVYDENGIKVATTEKKLDSWESEGTKKLFLMTPFIILSLKFGKPLIIDEFESKLHPLMTKGIIKIFNSKEYNPKNSQLIFTTHDTNFLKENLLRRDQICIVDKDSKGCSTIKTLVEIKGVRNDASYDKDYLNGVYGGIPFLHNLKEAVTF